MTDPNAIEIPVTRQEDAVPPTPLRSEKDADAFAIAVSTIMGTEGKERDLKEEYLMAGQSFEFEAFRDSFNRARTQDNQQLILDNAIQRANELQGLPTNLDQPEVDTLVASLIDEETRTVVGRQTGDDVLEAFMKAAYAGNLSEGRQKVLDSDEKIHYIWQEGQISEMIKAEQEMNVKNAELFLENLELMREEGISNDFGEILAGIGADMLVGSLYGRMWADLYEKLGGDDGWKHNWTPGQVIQRIQELIIEATPEERQEQRVLVEEFMANSDMAHMDLRKLFIAEYVAPALLGEKTADDDIAYLETGMFMLFDVIGFAAMTNLAKGVTKAQNPAMRVLARTNRERWAQHAKAGMDGNPADVPKLTFDPVEGAQGQMPKPDMGPTSKVDDIPGVSTTDRQRVADLQNQATDLANVQRRNILDQPERLNAVEREAALIEQAWAGQYRAANSTMHMHQDGNGVRFNITIGKNQRVGFLSERTAFEQVEQLNAAGTGVRVLVSDGAELKPFLTGKEALQELEAIRSGERKARRGNYYIQFERDYFFSPMDKLLFGDEVNLAPKWLGTYSRHVLTPSSMFGRQVYEPYLNNFLGEQAMVSTLDRIITPLFELNPNKRRQVAEMYEWSNSVGMKERRNVTMDELIQNFPDAGSDEMRGFYLLRKFYDTVYQLQNDRVYRDWNNRGFRTLTHAYGKLTLHGAPLPRESLRSRLAGGSIHAYDPETNGTRVLDRAQLDDLYDRGGSILEAELTIKQGDDAFHKLFIHDPKDHNWRLEALNPQPLTYIPGYWPRMYEDYYFIEKVVDNAKIDGKTQTHQYATHVVGTQKEAEALLHKLQNATEGTSTTWRIRSPSKDPRLSEKDRIAMDRERLQVEGRLFFDDRNMERLPNAQGNPADIIDPVNAIQRTSRMVSRQVATEDLIKGYKEAFTQQFGDLIPPITQHTSGEIAEILNKMAADSGGAPRHVAAANLWNYIRIMEGSVKRGPNTFKKHAIQAAEFVAETLNGIPAARRPSVWMYRNAHRMAPVELAKSLAFFDFIITRPIRQLVLQGSQHMFIQALDPSYAGRWQFDTFLLRSGLSRSVVEQSGGKKLAKQLVQRNAKLMGVSEEEYLILLDQVDKSGLVQAINVHSLAGEVGVEITSTGRDRVGDIAQGTAEAATLKPLRDVFRRKGFEAGEGYNVLASWLMALRQYRKTHGDKAIKDLNTDDWENIKAMGSNYALAMVRPNAAGFQYGLLSLPLQFVQFSHKAFLTMLRAIPGPAGQLGNKAFTPQQARKLVLGQMVLFGLGAGFGLKPEVEAMLEESGFTDLAGTDAADIIAGGMVDYILDESLRAITEDPELNLAWDEFLAPGANVINVARNLYEVAFETALFDGFLGPSEHTFSRMSEGYRLARYAFTRPDWDALERTGRGLDAIAAGMASGYSDFFKARVAARRGYWMSASGQNTGNEAKFSEIMAKGLLGLNPDYKNSQFESFSRTEEWKKELNDAGVEWARIVTGAYRAWSKDEMSSVDRDSIILGQMALMEMFDDDPETYNAILESFMSEMNRLGQTRESYTDFILNSLWADGLPPLEHTKAQLDKIGTISEEDREELKKLLDMWTEDAKAAGEGRREMLEDKAQEIIDD